jgi:hypothetical protein
MISNRLSPSIFGVTLVATFAAGSALALAQDAAAPAGPPAGPARRSLIGVRCKDEIPKFCADVPAGGGRLAACLRKHDAELSEPCKGALNAAAPAPKTAQAPSAPAAAAPVAAAAAPAPGMGRHHGAGPRMEWGPMHGMHKACGADVDKFCKEVPPGHGRVAVCLNEHPADLSPACKAVVGKVMEHMNEPMQAHADCAADAQKFCGDVPAGFGRTGFCLGEHSAELSPACKTQVEAMKSRWAKRGSKVAAKATPTAAPAPVAPAAAPPAPAAPPVMAAPAHPAPAAAPAPGK